METNPPKPLPTRQYEKELCVVRAMGTDENLLKYVKKNISSDFESKVRGWLEDGVKDDKDYDQIKEAIDEDADFISIATTKAIRQALDEDGYCKLITEDHIDYLNLTRHHYSWLIYNTPDPKTYQFILIGDDFHVPEDSRYKIKDSRENLEKGITEAGFKIVEDHDNSIV